MQHSPETSDIGETAELSATRLYGFVAALSNDERLRGRLLQSESIESVLRLAASQAGVGEIGTDAGGLARRIAHVVKVEAPNTFAKPQVNLQLSDLRGPARCRIILLWLAARISAVFDTPPLGGWRSVLRRRRKPSAPAFERPAANPSRRSSVLAPDEAAAKRAEFDALGKETWRMYVDWEDQEFGPEVYDKGLHGGLNEPGYLENALMTHRAVAATLGQRLDGRRYEALHHDALRYQGAWALNYDTTPRHLWRLREFVDRDVLSGLAPRHYRRIRHRRWETAAFNYLYGNDMEAFVRDNPLVAEVLIRKYGPRPRITAHQMDRDFFRIEVSLLEGDRTPGAVRAMLDRRFEQFYRRMEELTGSGLRDDDLEVAKLLEIAKQHRWLEYLHPYSDGNTRVSLLVLNKLLLENGFSPAILAQRNDAPYNSDASWSRVIREGMERWQAIRWLNDLGLLEHVLSLRPKNDLDRYAAARRGRK